MNITWTEHALIYYPMHGDIKLKKCKGYHTNRMLNRNSKDVGGIWVIREVGEHSTGRV